MSRLPTNLVAGWDVTAKCGFVLKIREP